MQQIAVLLGGASDTGRRLRPALEAKGFRVFSTSRQPGRADFTWDPKDGADPLASVLEQASSLDDGITVVNLIGGFLRDPYPVVVGSTRAALDALARRGGSGKRRYVHCSATSVYGHRPGERLRADQSEPRPHLEVGKAQTDAEETARTREQVDSIILRFPHIYGPGRERTFHLMAQGFFPVLGDGLNGMHHIHVEDCVQALVAACLTDRVGTFDVVDDGGSYGEYCDAIRQAVDRPPLPRIQLKDAQDSGLLSILLGPHLDQEEVLQALWDNMTCHRTIDPEPGRSALGLHMRFPDFRDGVRDLVHRLSPPELDAEAAARQLTERTLAALEGAMAKEPLSDSVGCRQAAHPLTPLTLESRLFRAEWGRVRVSYIHHPMHAFVSVLGVPRPEVNSPLLQLDLVYRGDDLASAIVDLHPMESELHPELHGWLEALRTADCRFAPRPPFMASVVSKHGLWARGGPPSPAAHDALVQLIHAWVSQAHHAAGASDPEIRREQMNQVIQAHRSRAERSSFLPRTFGCDWAQRFVPEVFFFDPS